MSAEMVDAYERDGFLVVPGFVTADACARLRDRANEMVRGWEPSERRSVFTTNEQERHSDQEFFDSGSGVWCFFEEEAVGPGGQLRQPKELSINKIGHAQHDLDDEFARFAYDPRLAELAADLGLHDLLALQSMYIFKQPSIGGEVSCHQDATFLFTDPVSVTGFWFAIEDATLDNGCLWAEPGGHRGPLRQLFKRASHDPTDGTVFEPLDTTPLPAPPDRAAYDVAGDGRGNGDGAGSATSLVPLEVDAGTLVVLHGLLPHWSGPNRSGNSRHAYSLHCISATADYPDWNWLQRPGDMPLRRLDAGSPVTI